MTNPEQLQVQTQPDKPESSIRLSMYKPGALESGQLTGLIREFYGTRAGWLGVYTANGERMRAREEIKKHYFLKAHPDVDVKDYDKIRSDQLERLKKLSRKGINKHFDKTVARRFHSKDPRVFANTQFANASHAMESVADTLFPHSGVVALRNETSRLPISPAGTVEKVASPNTDPVQRQEEIQRQLNAHVSAELSMRNGRQEADLKLAQIQALLNETLFAGLHGQTETAAISVIFDDRTNEPLTIGGIDTPRIYPSDAAQGQHIKTIELSMRTIKGAKIRVHTSHDIKSMDSAVLKAVRYAYISFAKTGDDQLRPAEVVQDTHRILFAIDGDRKQLERVYRKVTKILKDPANQQLLAILDESDEPEKNPDGSLRGRVTGIDEKPNLYNQSSKSRHVGFSRIMVRFDGLSVPIEIKFQRMKDFLMDEFHVGEYDAARGAFDGAAHDLYRYSRALCVRSYFIPNSAIQNEGFDSKTALSETLDNIVSGLRNSRKKAKK